MKITEKKKSKGGYKKPRAIRRESQKRKRKNNQKV